MKAAACQSACILQVVLGLPPSLINLLFIKPSLDLDQRAKATSFDGRGLLQRISRGMTFAHLPKFLESIEGWRYTAQSPMPERSG